MGASVLRAALALIFVAGALASPGVAAQSLQSQPWREIATEHFVVHGHASVASLLPDVASMAEAAHRLLAPVFGEPDGRTAIVVSDPFDSANGSASVVPRRVIQVYAYPPETMSTLGFHDNWMWNLLVHEYTHILHMDSMGRGFTWLNLPFGRRWAPNQALPRWLIEGLATWQESVQSGTGRVYSNLFRMQLRAAAIAGQEPRLGTLAGFPGDWPNAGMWYLQGAFFVDAIARWHGAASWAEFVERYGRRAVPYGINAAAIDVFGEDFGNMYARFVAAERVAAATFVASRTLHGVTATEPVSATGFRTMDVAVDPVSGTVVWIEAGGDRPAGIRWRSTEGDGFEPMAEADDLAVVPGGREVIVTEPFAAGAGVSRSDLVAIELASGASRRLTFGSRASEPAVSPSGAMLAYVSPSDGRSDLWILERATGATRRVASSDAWSLFGTPAFIDEDTLVASLHRPGAGRDLVQVDLRTGVVDELVAGHGEAFGPCVVPGSTWVVFSDDRDGVFSLYAVSTETREQVQLTRPLTGHFAPAAAQPVDGELTIYAAEYSASGYDIVSTQVVWPPQASIAFDARPTVDERPPIPAEAVTAMPRRHRDSRAFVPYRWMPGVSAAGGDSLFGISLAGADVSGRHDWVALLNWSLGFDTPVWAVSGQTSVLPLPVRVSSGRVVVERTESLRAGSVFVPFDEQQWSFGLGTDAVFDQQTGVHVVSLDWSLFRTQFLRQPSVRHAPEDLEPRYPAFPRLDSIGFGWSWSSLASSARAVSTQTGVAISVGSRFRGSFSGADVESAEVGASVRGFVSMPYHDHHVVALRLSGGLSRARGVGRRLYAVGGPEPQDVLQAMVDSLPIGTSHVRGFEPQARVGDRFALSTVEYRLALFRWHAGFSTLPLVFERLALAVFGDAGYAGSDIARWRDMIGGIGAELRLETTISYFQGASLRFGVARGIGRGAITDMYLLYGWWF